MWTTVAYVSSGVTLIAFVVAVVANIIRQRGLRQKVLIESAPPSERAALIDKTLEFFDVEASGLTKQQQFELAKQQIQAKADRFRMMASIVMVIAVLGIAVLAAALVLAPSPTRPPVPTTDIDPYKEFGIDIRKQIKLTKDGEAETDGKYMGIAAAEFSRDGETLYAEVKRVNDYHTPWQVGEAEQAIRDRANQLKDSHPLADVRQLADIKLTRVTNLVTDHGTLRESLVQTADRPPLEAIYQLRQAPVGSSSSRAQNIRYFIESSPDISAADKVIAQGFQKWSDILPIEISRVQTRRDANLIVKTSLLAFDAFCDATVGPPRTFDQLSMVFNTGKVWTPELLAQVACHEMGHILGLIHTDTPNQLMNPLINLTITEPQSEDIERARGIWGRHN